MASHRVKTDRLEMHLVESGPPDGSPGVLLHGNLSTGRFVDARRPGHRRGRRLAVRRWGRSDSLGLIPGSAGRGRVRTAADGGADPRRPGALHAAAGGRVETEWFEESGHFPPLDARERWQARFFGFLESVA